MAQHHQGLVDLLEIYHARQLKAQVLDNLRRLSANDPFDPQQDPLRRRETQSYYEAMLITVVELLNGLGDDLHRP